VKHREGLVKLSQFFSPARTPRSTPAVQTVETIASTDEYGIRPTDSALDLFGITHPGNVRAENQDHFFVGTIHPEVNVHGTSLANAERLPLRGQRLATVFLVADGVGGQFGGGAASRLAAETITAYVSSTLRCYHAAGSSDDKLFLDALRAAAMNAHDTVSVESAMRGEGTMATTLTFGIAVWPWLYVLQVGDSRAYFCCDGALRQITRDQTVAQDLVDQGVLTPERAAKSPYTHVLSSAIGGSAAAPVVTRIDVRGDRPVVLLCSDGLTKHVTDREIEQHVLGLESSEQLCRALLELALQRGGSDNITIVVGRVKTSPPAAGSPQRD
jgi:serine/threonine protein phosphatase PrpC